MELRLSVSHCFHYDFQKRLVVSFGPLNYYGLGRQGFGMDLAAAVFPAPYR